MFELGNKLLLTLEKCRLPRNDETVKGIGWFLVCIGESIAKGSLIQARRIRSQPDAAMQMQANNSLGVAFCSVGDQVMDWGTGILLREKKANDKTSSVKGSSSKDKSSNQKT